MKYGRNTEPPAKHRKQKEIEIDFVRHAERMSDEGYSAEQIETVLAYLWELACTFVEFGYGVHPVQHDCGQDEINHSSDANSSSNKVNCPLTKQFSAPLTRAVQSAMSEPEKEEA